LALSGLKGEGWSVHLEGTVTIQGQEFPWKSDAVAVKPKE